MQRVKKKEKKRGNRRKMITNHINWSFLLSKCDTCFTFGHIYSLRMEMSKAAIMHTNLTFDTALTAFHATRSAPSLFFLFFP